MGISALFTRHAFMLVAAGAAAASPFTVAGGANAATRAAPAAQPGDGAATYSSPAVVDLKSLGEAVAFGGGSTSFNAYAAATGALLWSFPVAKPVNSSPAVRNGVVYSADTDGTMYAPTPRTTFSARNRPAPDPPLA
jgi:outer membrane protein assembly factor BamB